MGDEEGSGTPYAWTSLEPLPEGVEEAVTAKFVKTAGRAKVAYPNGDAFEGTFNEAQQKHGRGVYTWGTNTGANAWVPEEGFPEGKAPTVRYDGQYVEGKKHGIGKITFPNGESYQGQWVDNKYHGDGTYKYSNGDIYSGGWDKGVKSGQGVFKFRKDDSQLIGTWLKGHMVTGKWVFKDGSSWHGPFKNSQPLGRGIFYFPNGTCQEGEYVQEGDAEDADAELKISWRGQAAREANTSAAELLRVA